MKKIAFTMAEILLSLTIIGVVAAITLPSLMGNINERTWNTQRKALHARMSQAIAMMPQLNGYGTYIGTYSEGDHTFSITEDNVAEAFLTEGLSKVLKINNICDNDHLKDCGIPENINPIGGSSAVDIDDIKTLMDFNAFLHPAFNHHGYSTISTKAAAFETQNGESVLLYYNPNCITKPDTEAIDGTQLMCANFVYDLNGNKGPNAIGKDMGFMTALYSVDSVVVAPMLFATNYTAAAVKYDDAVEFCDALGDDVRLPNIEELSSIMYNTKLFSFSMEESSWSSSAYSPGENGKAWTVNLTAGGGQWYLQTKTQTSASALCIKR